MRTQSLREVYRSKLYASLILAFDRASIQVFRRAFAAMADTSQFDGLGEDADAETSGFFFLPRTTIFGRYLEVVVQVDRVSGSKLCGVKK